MNQTPSTSPEEIERKRQAKEDRKRAIEEKYKEWLKKKSEQSEANKKNKTPESDRLFSSRPRVSLGYFYYRHFVKLLGLGLSRFKSLSYGNSKRLTYEEWLELKVEKYKREREFESHLFELNMEDRFRITPEERMNAVKRWRQRKLNERKYERQLRSLEDEQWLGRARSSRKHLGLYEARYTDISYSRLRTAGLVD